MDDISKVVVSVTHMFFCTVSVTQHGIVICACHKQRILVLFLFLWKWYGLFETLSRSSNKHLLTSAFVCVDTKIANSCCAVKLWWTCRKSLPHVFSLNFSVWCVHWMNETEHIVVMVNHLASVRVCLYPIYFYCVYILNSALNILIWQWSGNVICEFMMFNTWW